jgi:hypothetical protein
MQNGRFDGRKQEFYYSEDYKKAGLFKGMAKILTECGYNVSREKAVLYSPPPIPIGVRAVRAECSEFLIVQVKSKLSEWNAQNF